ncbi:Ubiquitin-protein ligase E3B [Entophlyctis luteolus]|nr:Ubiquitin-protein ligase E3B [Entophlyctis luteolus]
MDFAPSGKESVAAKARRERIQREELKRLAADEEKASRARTVICRGLRRCLDRTAALQRISEEVDAVSSSSVTAEWTPHEAILQAHLIVVAASGGHFDVSGSLSKICKIFVARTNLGQEIIFTKLFSDDPYFNDVYFKCLLRFSELCWDRVLSSNYRSGSELLFLMTLFDKVKWKDRESFAILIKGSLMENKELWTKVHAALSLNVKLVAGLKKSKKHTSIQQDDEKKFKSLSLWLNAIIHLCVVLLEPSSTSDWITIFNYILSVPLLVMHLEKPGQDCLSKANTFFNCVRVRNEVDHSPQSRFDFISGELSVFVLGNLIELYQKDKGWCLQKQSSKFDQETSAFIETSYVKSKSSNMTRFHPVFQWYNGPSLDIPQEFYECLLETMSFMWSRMFVETAFSPLLEYLFPPPKSLLLKNSKVTTLFAKFGFQPATTGVKVNESEAILLAIETLSACKLFAEALQTFLNLKSSILGSLSWTPSLIPKLWRLVNIVGPHQDGQQLFLSAASTGGLAKEPLVPLLQLFCEACCVQFMSLDDADIYEKQYPFVLEELAQLSKFLNRFCFNVIWASGNIHSGDSEVFDAAQRLLRILYDQSSRIPLGNMDVKPDGERVDDWVIKEVNHGNIVGDVLKGDERTVAVLQHMPQCIPFAKRVEIFRLMVKADKKTIGEVPMVITVRRRAVFEDGFKQLSQIAPSQLKQTIKVRFINEFGLVEAGIDQNGVFKEFLEDICKLAFSQDFGLFKTTDDGNCVPSVSSSVQDNHLQLLEFIGKIFSKALYEGIIIDIPFATFVYAKMLGRLNFFEDLPSLDQQLYRNLVFLKHYDGDAADLGLTFTIDERVFGTMKTHEIKPGGAVIEVSNENKFEYIHLMADYRLNQECKAQFKAFVGGFRSIMPEKLIRFFSPRELQTLMGGENVNFDVSDLRQCTRYEGGYFDQHPTIRMLWQIVEEFSPKEKVLSCFISFG